MTGTIKSLDPKGFGMIDAQDGSKIPFLFKDVRNQFKDVRNQPLLERRVLR